MAGGLVHGHPLVDQLVAGCAAGGAASLILHPLDLLKTRFQATTGDENCRPFSVPRELRRIYLTGGWRGLYRGLSANFAGATVSWGLYFVLYTAIQERVFPPARPHQTQPPRLRSWQYFVASGGAGVLTVLAANPLWLAKTRLCQPPDGRAPPPFSGLRGCLAHTWRTEGWRGLYRGLVPGLFGTSHGAVQFALYEKLKGLQAARGGGTKPSTTEYLCMSAASKIAAAAITYPYQVVRCRIQLSPSSAGPSRTPAPAYASIRDVIARTWRYSPAGVRERRVGSRGSSASTRASSPARSASCPGPV